MTDLCAQKRQFKNLSRKECDQLLREAVKIIKSRITLGVTVSCDVNAVDRLAPKFMVGFGHAYPVCCHLVMGICGTWLKENRPSERIIYTFEAGHEFEGEANLFLAGAINTPDVREFYRYGGHSFLPKTDAIPLQAADLLAWEWTKFKDETFDRGIRPIRRSLRALMDGNLHRYKTAHLKNESLKKYLDHVRTLGLLQIQEEKEAQIARQIGKARDR